MSRQPFSRWVLTVIWVVQALALVPLFTDAAESLSSVGRWLMAFVLWGTWATVLLATFVPSTVSLTAGRMLAPAVLVAALIAGIFGSVAGWKLAIGIAVSLIATLAWFSAEVGQAYVQGSAYGAEERFPLKPPVPLLVPMVISWSILAALAIGGVGSIANANWIVGALLSVAAVALSVLAAPRFHRLSRRWFVVVPVGVVVHDPILLAENTLFRTSTVAALHLAAADTAALDLTGATAGVALEVVLNDMETVVKAGNRDSPNGVAVHALSLLVAPSRPGRALSAAAAWGLPVG